MVLCHHKNMGRFAEEFLREALAAKSSKIETIASNGIDSITAGWVALSGADSSRLNSDVFARFFS